MKDIIIDEEIIQQEAEQELERKLTPDELDQVWDAIYTENPALWQFIREKVCTVIEYNEMIIRNENVDKNLPYYKVYQKHQNSDKTDFKEVDVFKSKEDALCFIDYGKDIWSECKITFVDKNNIEQEVYKK